jgi:hypothetical protein
MVFFFFLEANLLLSGLQGQDEVFLVACTMNESSVRIHQITKNDSSVTAIGKLIITVEGS